MTMEEDFPGLEWSNGKLRWQNGPGGGGGRFIRIGMVGDDDTAEELRIANKRSEANDQSSRWIRIGVNQEHPDWGRIAKKAEGKEWNADVDKFDSDLLEESVDVEAADVDGLWDNEVGEKERGEDHER